MTPTNTCARCTMARYHRHLNDDGEQFHETTMADHHVSGKGLRIFSGLLVCTEIIGLLAVVLTAVWMGHYRGGFAWQKEPHQEFNYHPFFMILGLVFLQANAILMYRVFRNTRKIVLKVLHGCVHISALVFAAVGLKAVFDSHNLATRPIPNLYSLHSWLGILTVILFSLQWLMGLITFLLPHTPLSVRRFVMPYHVFSGVMIFLLACTTSLVGVTEKALFSSKSMSSPYSKLPPEGILLNSLGFSVIGLAILVVYLVTKSAYKRQPTPDEQYNTMAGITGE